jgi:hypothetical protein
VARVYLETSFVSACVTTRSSLRSVYEREASLFWWRSDAKSHDVFVSQEVIGELSSPLYPRRNEAIELIRGVSVIPITEAMIEFGQILVDRKVMPRPVAGDALHVAIAAVSEMDYLLTWNVRHLANPNKILHLNAICLEYGLIAPKILRPDDLREMEP